MLAVQVQNSFLLNYSDDSFVWCITSGCVYFLMCEYWLRNIETLSKKSVSTLKTVVWTAVDEKKKENLEWLQRDSIFKKKTNNQKP